MNKFLIVLALVLSAFNLEAQEIDLKELKDQLPKVEMNGKVFTYVILSNPVRDVEILSVVAAEFSKLLDEPNILLAYPQMGITSFMVVGKQYEEGGNKYVDVSSTNTAPSVKETGEVVLRIVITEIPVCLDCFEDQEKEGKQKDSEEVKDYIEV